LRSAVAGAQLDGAFRLERGAVGQIGLQQALFLQVAQCAGRVGEEFGAPALELLPKYSTWQGFMNSSSSLGR